jgi:hypothetical protein
METSLSKSMKQEPTRVISLQSLIERVEQGLVVSGRTFSHASLIRFVAVPESRGSTLLAGPFPTGGC